MANPRKFSEKIALLNQKEAEGNAEFERIMREVSEVSSKDEPQTTLAGLLTTSGYSNDITKNGNSADGKASSRESRGRSVGGGPIRPRSRNIDTSPYSSNNTAYLSPPESSWRRTSSDSAIHQSLAQAQDIHDVVHNSLMLSPRAHKRLSSSQSNSMKNLHHQQQNSPTISQQHSHSQQNMPQTFDQQTLMQQHQQAINQHQLLSNLQQDMKSRSVSRLPGINVYPSQNEDTLQIPVGNSTGSLPDLTLVHYQQSPLSTPIDLEHDHLIAVTSSSFNTNSSYSMPMVMNANQSSSNQLPSLAQHQIYHQLGQQQTASNNLENFSPKHFSNNNNNSSSNNKVSSSSSQGFQGSNNSTYTQQSSPIPIDTNHQRQPQQHSPLHHQSYPNNQISAEKLMSYRSANTASPANLSSSQGNLSKISYRNSPHSRPSPGSSPNNVPGLSANFDSNSSAPCSPSPMTTGNNGQFDTFSSVDSFYINPSIQQHFEQFSLVDSPLSDYITTANDQNYPQMNDNYNGMMDDSPNRQGSPTNRSSTPSSRTNVRSGNNSNHMNRQTNNNNSSNHSNNGSSPHSPLSTDSMLAGNTNYDNMNCDGLRNLMGSSVLDGALLNGGGSGNGINDIMLGGGLGSDSSSKLITSSSAALQTSLMMSQTSPSHLINNTQTTTSIPEIVFSDYSSGSDFLINDNFLELGTTELQMFEHANIIDPAIEDSFRRDLY